MRQKRVIVIGSGVAGMASAVRLAAKGFTVEIFESASQPGGKLTEMFKEGFRFDRGPSLFTLPHLLDEVFSDCGKNPRDYYKYDILPVICQYFYEDGTILNAYRDPVQLASEIEAKTGEKAEKVLRFLEKSKKIYALTSNVFLFRSFHQISTFFSQDFLRALLQWYKLDPFTTMHARNSKIFDDNRIIQLFDRYATYNGSDPYQAPATLNVIPHLEHNIGAFFPEGGMYTIIKSLLKLAEESQVSVHTGKRIDEIVLSGKKVSGVRVGNDLYPADVVVSDADVVTTYGLLKNYPIPERYMTAGRSTSALIFYWGIHGNHPDLDLHNVLFSSDYKKEFEYLFRKKSIYEDPTVYIFISKRRVRSDAPEGSENWFVMINTPENVGQDWDTLIRNARRNILTKIERVTGSKVEQEIVTETILDPRKIEEYTSSWRGSLYGMHSNSVFSAFLRHPNWSRKIRGLYFCGGSVHPGGGIPLCLSSAKLVTEMVCRRER
ncbi:MAG TPA: phytoene desaturase family protein [Bacteroidales bacterium]|nr:phytoene desaturase family protein [Bacteroidales bacterium]